VAGELVILGDLDGYFYTRQEVPLGHRDEEGIHSKPENFHVNLYRGTISNAQTLAEFHPQEYENYNSLCLVGVPSLIIEPSPKTGFATSQNLQFSSLILIDPVYVNHWYSNRDVVYPEPDPDDANNPKVKDDKKDKVYVHVRSRVIGRTADPTAGIIPQDSPPSAGSDDKKSILPDKVQGCLTNAEGCLQKAGGCFTQIWKWLLWLLLLGLLWWLLKSCDEANGGDTCAEAEKLKKETAVKQRELDSLNKVLEKGMKQELRNISKLYFYENSADFTVSSESGASVLTDFLNQYPKAGLEITGFVNGNPAEAKGTDQQRAQKVAELLKEGGIPEKRFRIKWAGTAGQQAGQDRQKNSQGRFFNRNMRTEATLYLLNDGE
jgi:outer membrane protein OmpA-like peptidoglycan-associated protein